MAGLIGALFIPWKKKEEWKLSGCYLLQHNHNDYDLGKEKDLVMHIFKKMNECIFLYFLKYRFDNKYSTLV